jgi:hypothetical protein
MSSDAAAHRQRHIRALRCLALLAGNLAGQANARKGARTFARRHLGAGDGGRERHECGGDGGIYPNATSGHADAGNLAAEPSLAVWDGRWNLAAIADVKLLRDLPASIACRDQGLWRPRVIGAAPVVLAVPAREDPPAHPSAPSARRSSNTTDHVRVAHHIRIQGSNNSRSN